MSGAVGDRVGRSEEDLVERHGVAGYAIRSTCSWQAVAAVAGAWMFEPGVRVGLSHRGGVLVIVALSMCAVFVILTRTGTRMLVTVALMVTVGAVSGARSSAEWSVFDAPVEGRVSGPARVVSDPSRVDGGVRLVLEHHGRRFEGVVHGPLAWVADDLVAGMWVDVDGRIHDGARARRLAVRHIVGVVEIARLHVPRGSPETRMRGLERSSMFVRGILARGASSLAPDDAALFAGLVYGDDSGQSRAVVEDFRSSGLAHLTAVSGQNVGYLMTLVAPLLRRRGRWTRLSATLVLLLWFTTLTRSEPSVVRAGGMAAVSAVMLAFGVRRHAIDVLTSCVVVFVVVDPLLVWSVGWWLSVAGTLGLVVFTPSVHRAMRVGVRRRWIADWIAPTLSAQIGVFPVALVVFGWPNAWAIPANLIAGPVAGVLMLVGLPLALLAGSWPSVAAVAMFGPLLAVRWVALVAAVAAHLRPPPALNVALVVGGPLLAVAVGRSRRHRCANVGA